MCVLYKYNTDSRGKKMDLKNGEKLKEQILTKQNMLYVEMGRRLRIIRIELNYTQEQMAEILEMSSAY